MTSMERLALWTAIALLAWGVTLWMLRRAAARYRAVQGRAADVRAVHRMRLVCAGLLLVAWTGIICVGVLGFYPAWSEYRSWAMLLSVTTLAVQQIWNTYAWERIGR